MRVSEYKNILTAIDRAVVFLTDHRNSTYRVTTRVWKYTLLTNREQVNDINPFVIIGKNMGAGVYELSVKP